MDIFKKWLSIAMIFILSFSLLSPTAMAEEIQPNVPTTLVDVEQECIPAKIRIESWLETLIPLQEMCITPFDDGTYNLTADNPVIGHLLISALQEATDRIVDLEDANISNSGYGMYLESIGEYGAYSMDSGMDGWMYKKNFDWANGMSNEELQPGDRIDFYYVGNYAKVVFSEISANKSNAYVQEDISITLTDVDAEEGIADAVIYINGEATEYKTDSDGEVKIQFDQAGKYSISAERYESEPEDMSDNNNIIRPVPITIDVQNKQDTEVINAIKLINELPSSVTVDETTKLQLTQARTLYDTLTPEQQKLVTNIDVLIQKESLYTSLIDVQQVEKQINELPSVEALVWDIRETVEQAVFAYEKLSDEQKSFVTNYSKLALLQAKLETIRPVAVTTQQAYTTVGQYMINKLPTPKFGSEWMIVSLARGGYEVPEGYYDTYYNNVVDHVKSVNGELHALKYTEYSRLILALTAIGKDPRDVGGYNIVEKLSDYDQVIWQGLNGAYFGLIALDTWGFELTQTATTSRQKLIDFILSKQLADGGFDLSDKKADPDMTAMAIQALAPYYNQENVKSAIDRAVTTLATIQTETGGFASWGAETSESVSQVLTALSSIGIDVAKDDRFNKTLSNLMSYYSLVDGGFKHTLKETKANGMATEQAGYSLAAYNRLLKEQPSLYNMVDTKPADVQQPTPNENEQTSPGDVQQPTPNENEQTSPGDVQQPTPNENEQPKPEQAYGHSTFSIAISSADVPLAPVKTEIFKGDTAFDVLKRVTTEKGISLSYRTTSYGVYIDGINGLFEFDKGPESGWMYRVNGVFPSYSAALYTLQPGDRVEWLYTTNLGKDIGGYVEEIVNKPSNPTPQPDSDKDKNNSTANEVEKEKNPTETINESESNNTTTEQNSKQTGLTINEINQYVQNQIDTVVIQHANDTKIELPTSTLSSLGLEEDEKIVTAASAEGKEIHIDLTLEAKNGTKKAFSTGKAYAKVTLTPTELTANTVVLQLVDGTYKAVPHTIADGKLIILTKTSGTFIVTDESKTFKDISKVSNKEEIEFLANRHVIQGVNEDTFEPNKSITRAQFAAMISRALGLQASEEHTFNDTAGKWYEQDVQALYEAGITTGKTDNTFDPSGLVTRQQAAAFMARVLTYVNLQTQSVTTTQFKDINKINAQYIKYIELLNSLNIMTGKEDGTFDPQSSLTRAQMAKILKRTLNIADLM